MSDAAPSRAIRGNSTLGWMGAVLGLAAFLAVLRRGLQHWGRGELITLTVGALFLASIPMLVRAPGRRRAFWDGFALFGWFYLIVTLAPWPWNTDPAAPPLPTTRLFEALYPYVHPKPERLFRLQTPWDLPELLAQHRSRYLQSCHALTSLGFGLVGGMLFRFRAGHRPASSVLDPPGDDLWWYWPGSA